MRFAAVLLLLVACTDPAIDRPIPIGYRTVDRADGSQVTIVSVPSVEVCDAIAGAACDDAAGCMVKVAAACCGWRGCAGVVEAPSVEGWEDLWLECYAEIGSCDDRAIYTSDDVDPLSACGTLGPGW